ncbi:ATP-binding cassette domain-containing protein [Mucilaginibacter sp. BJC16-A38]|uniref:ATP-binding cassette domain-containing protein n=1 Tax=Mucilaginibacter phenanthrenivorans TaxID=1234842 RepID=UPI0021579FB7|nr:ATP-binding cassette domain-containing protein [Mucilaginibacter phenanthrenivorans]MCR8556062.1 ATP-binding cassette domain-containing protein [Mucilaginibacter phenanthrenivorans]
MDLPLISINNATVRFLNNPLFTGLNFLVDKGKSWALIGKSGSGKSALLHTIAGRFNITGGEINFHFFDEFLRDTPNTDGHLTHHKLIALVEPKHHFKNLSNTSDFYYQQRYNSSDSEDALTVEQYLHSIKPASDKNIYWTFEKTTKLLNLGELLTKQIIKLSNGETKRLMLAAALLKSPVLLLLDSPLTGLDVQTRKEFNAIIDEIIKSGITIIMATSPYEIPDAITDVAVLQDGVIIQGVSRDKFDPKQFIEHDEDEVDNEELKALLNPNTNKSAYKYIVKMNDVFIKYGEKVILNKINWQIVPGERWALLGPNGAGKSTLLSLINADNPQAYANDIILFDKKRGTGESIWDIKSKIGFVSPELHQYFPTDNSCLQVIESGYYDTLGLFRPSQKAKADTALRWMKALEIDKYARVLLKNIPASAQRLCLLARALIKNTDLLIFDEPCQGLDDHQQHHFKTLVDTICRLSTVTLIYVTHYQHEIPDSVTKVLKLDKGNVA